MSSSFAQRGTRRRGLTYIVLIGLSLAMLALSGSGPVQELRRGINFAVGPLRDALSDSTRSMTGFFDALGEVDTLRRVNVELQEQIDGLESEVAAMAALRERNAELEKVLKTTKNLGRKTVIADVVARPSSRFESVISIDRGSEADIRVGDPVLSRNGALAGSISDVSDGRAEVMLINDTRSLVIGIDRRSDATGNVVGRLSAPLGMTDVRATDEVALGDVVVTAGLEQGQQFRSRFPKGIPIGRVVSVREEPGLAVQTALIAPTADLDRLETVIVIIDVKGRGRAAQPEADSES